MKRPHPDHIHIYRVKSDDDYISSPMSISSSISITIEDEEDDLNNKLSSSLSSSPEKLRYLTCYKDSIEEKIECIIKRINYYDNEQVDDDTVYNILTLFINHFKIASGNILDSQLITQYMKISPDIEYLSHEEEKKLNKMKSYFRHSSQTNYVFTLIPIYYNHHWSLLIYFNQVRLFYHFDSLKGYHSQYMTDFLIKLGTHHILKIVKSHKDDTDYDKIIYPECINQEYGYECGYYIMMYAYSFIICYSNYFGSTITTDSSNIREFNKILKNYIRKNCYEYYRKVFLYNLMRWLRNDDINLSSSSLDMLTSI